MSTRADRTHIKFIKVQPSVLGYIAKSVSLVHRQGQQEQALSDLRHRVTALPFVPVISFFLLVKVKRVLRDLCHLIL